MRAFSRPTERMAMADGEKRARKGNAYLDRARVKENRGGQKGDEEGKRKTLTTVKG